MIILQVTEEQFTAIRVALGQMESANYTNKEEAITAMLRGEGGAAQELTNELLRQYQQQIETMLETADGRVIDSVYIEAETLKVNYDNVGYD